MRVFGFLVLFLGIFLFSECGDGLEDGSRRPDGRTEPGLEVVDPGMEPESAPSSPPWREARDRGVDFRAVGQEPGWFLEITDGDSILLALDYGQRRMVLPAPIPERDPEVEALVYRTATDSQQVMIAIRGEPCQDIMSGESFPASVRVEVDGESFDGCGRAPW